MTTDEFIQAKLFAFADIERELQLAKTDGAALQSLGIHTDGGNFLSTVGVSTASRTLTWRRAGQHS